MNRREFVLGVLAALLGRALPKREPEFLYWQAPSEWQVGECTINGKPAGKMWCRFDEHGPKPAPLVVPIGHGSIATILEPLGFTVDLTDYTHRPRWGGGSDGNLGA